jgi:protein gp37
MKELARSFADLEDVIRRGQQSVFDVGNALREIRDRKLYFEEQSPTTGRKYSTFAEYCDTVWAMKRSRAYQQIEAALIVNNLSTKVDTSDKHIPIDERQARPLAALPAEAQREVAKTIDFTRATAAEVEERVREYRASVTESKATKSKPKTEPKAAASKPTTAPKPEPLPVIQPKRDFITLEEWKSLGAAERAAALNPANRIEATFNQQTTDSIEWARFSWNPVTGCQHNCPYCYARDIANRFFPQKFEPAFKPQLLDAPNYTNVPDLAATDIGYKNVFVCSMADLFGKWVPPQWIEAVLNQVAANPQWNFLFLTKFPQRMAEFEYPDNAWLGTSVDLQVRVKNAEQAMAKVKAKVRWLSLEPLLERIQMDWSQFNWIVMGGASQSTETPEWRPPMRWIWEITFAAQAKKCIVYHKTNLYGERLRDFPGVAAAPDCKPGREFQYLKVLS